MGAKRRPVVDQTKSTDTGDSEEAWVSPDVLAAQAGDRIEMGKELPEVQDADVNNE